MAHIIRPISYGPYHMGYFIVNRFLLSGTREIFAKLLDKNEYELYFLIGSTNVKKQIYTTSNGKVKDDSVTFEYEKSLKTELEEFDDLGKVHNKISSNNDNLWQHRCW